MYYLSLFQKNKNSPYNWGHKKELREMYIHINRAIKWPTNHQIIKSFFLTLEVRIVSIVFPIAFYKWHHYGRFLIACHGLRRLRRLRSLVALLLLACDRLRRLSCFFLLATLATACGRLRSLATCRVLLLCLLEQIIWISHLEERWGTVGYGTRWLVVTVMNSANFLFDYNCPFLWVISGPPASSF